MIRTRVVYEGSSLLIAARLGEPIVLNTSILAFAVEACKCTAEANMMLDGIYLCNAAMLAWQRTKWRLKR